MAALLCLSSAAHAATTLKMCVYDPMGSNGDGFLAARDYKVEMSEHGVDLDLKAYTDERVAVEDFKTGQCDAVMATALRTRQFNNTAAALDSVGASSIVRNGKLDLPASYEVVRRFIQTMAQPKAAELMVEGQYEIAGMFPLGAAYAFMRDRSMASLDELVGKRVGTFDHDKAQAELVQKLGARPVSVDINNVGPTFNNGNVDMVAVPTVAYKPFELFRGVGTKGGVLRFPLTISTYQMVIRSAKYPAGFGQQSREYIARNFDLAMATLKLADRGIPENQWVDLTPADSERYQKTIKQVRIQMAENGYYDKKGLKLIKKIRCSMNGEAAECTDGTEAW
jgi:hypothetical protein